MQTPFLHLLLFTLKVLFVPVRSEYREITNFSKESMCNRSEFYHVETLSCVYCDVHKNLKPSPDKQSCVCDDVSKMLKGEHSDSPQCAPCPKGEAPTHDGRSCVPCSNTKADVLDTKDMPDFSSAACVECKKSEIVVERDAGGKLLAARTCVACSEGAKPSPDRRSCAPCANETCACPVVSHEYLGDGICAPRTATPSWLDDSATYSVDFPRTHSPVDSAHLRDNLRIYVYLCKMRRRRACQALANACVMSLYRHEPRSGPCHMLRDTKPASDKDPYPWLYYGEGEAPTVLSRKKVLSKYSLDDSSPRSRLQLNVAAWSADGGWRGLANATASALCLCADSAAQTAAALRFGADYRRKCTIAARDLLDRETVFYEPHLFTEHQLYAIPVLIRNLKQGNKYPNKFSDKSQWQLTRRYFLSDRISGVPSRERDSAKGSQGGGPRALRYVKHSTLSVRVQDDPDGLIYPPLLDLDYGVLTADEIEANVAVTITFNVRFHMEDNVAHYIEVWVGVLSACAVIWAALRTWTQARRSGRTTIDLTTLAELCLVTAGHLSDVFFGVVAFAAAYTFVFYKGQAVVQLLLPDAHVMFLTRTYICIAFCLKAVEVLRMVWYQVCVDIFLVDWERPRSSPHHDGEGGTQAAHPVSIWRTYFVANEWNEIQTRRKTSVAFQLVSTVFLLKVCGLEEWARAGPDLAAVEHPYSPLLRFSVALIIYLTIYVSQWLFMMGVYERYVKNAIQEFVDVCSIANISVFVLALENFGYYIHGRSAHGFADTDMKTIMTQLQREEQDLVGHRGLLPASDQQTFQISIPSQLREYYRRVMAAISSSDNQAGRKNSGLLAAGLKNKMSSGNIDLERSSQAYQSMNKFLAAFLEHALKDLDYEVREKLFVEALLDIEFSDSQDRGVFYCDNGNSFDNVLFYGNEVTLVSFDLVTFCFVEVLTQNFLLAAIATGTTAAVSQ